MRNAAANRRRVDWRKPADFGANAGDWRKGSCRTEARRLVQVAAAGNCDSNVSQLVAPGGLPEFCDHSAFAENGEPTRAADVFVDFGEHTQRNSAGVCDATGRACGAVRGCTCRRHLFDLRHSSAGSKWEDDAAALAELCGSTEDSSRRRQSRENGGEVFANNIRPCKIRARYRDRRVSTAAICC